MFVPLVATRVFQYRFSISPNCFANLNEVEGNGRACNLSVVSFAGGIALKYMLMGYYSSHTDKWCGGLHKAAALSMFNTAN